MTKEGELKPKGFDQYTYKRKGILKIILLYKSFPWAA